MKKILLSLLVSSVCLAAEKPAEKPPTPPVQIVKPRALATINPDTRKVTYEKDVEPEEVVEVLLEEISRQGQMLQQCQEELSKKPAKKSGKG